MAEEKGFGYVSPEKQRKNAARILTVEIILLLIAGLVIILILNYLGVVPLYRFAPRIFGFLPVRSGIDKVVKGPEGLKNKPQIILPTPNFSNVNRNISVVSDNQTIFNVDIVKEDELLDILNSWKVFEQIVKINTSGQREVSTPLVIHVTTSPLSGGRILDKNGNIATSIATSLSKEESFDILVHINPDSYASTAELTDAFQSQILSHLYRLTHKAVTEQEASDREKNIIEEIQNINKTKGRLFSVEKL